MRKIFRYECRRLLWNKFFVGPGVGAAVLRLAWCWSGATILGVSHTAPFSPWSFGDYLSRMLPLLWVGVLFFLTFFTSGRARRAMALTDAAPMHAPPLRAGPMRRRPDRERRCWRCAALRRRQCSTGRYFGWYGVGQACCFPPLVDPACLRWCSPWAAAGCWAGWRPWAALCLDAGSVCVYGSAAARGTGGLERAVSSPSTR